MNIFTASSQLHVMRVITIIIHCSTCYPSTKNSLGSLVRLVIPRKCFIQLCVIFSTLEDEEYKLTEKEPLCTHPLFYALPKK